MLIEREMSEFTWSRQEPQDEAGPAAPPTAATLAAARLQPVPALQLLESPPA